jgi:hypothetical protein
MRGVRAAVWGALAAFGLIAAAQSAVAQSEPPVGLVMALTGSTSPPVAAMAEIPAGTPLRLAPDAQLTFLHYGRCKLVTVSGGTLSLSRTEFQTDGQIVADKDGPCPRLHSLGGGQAGTVTGGMMMRGGGELPRLPLDPEIIVAGNGSNDIKAAAIYAEDKFEAPLVQMPVSGHTLLLPAAGERLAPNGRYVLRLMMAGGATPVDLPFIGTAPDGPELVLLLH